MKFLIFYLLLSSSVCFAQSYRIELDKDSSGNFIPCSDISKRYILKEFDLTKNVKYSIEIYEDSISYLCRIKNGKILERDTFFHYTTIFSYLSCEIICPSLSVEDFNKDGYNDLVAVVSTNVNANLWSKILLFNPVTESLQEIYSAEDDSIWAAPEYNIIDSTIKCEQVSGIYGLSYQSKYKLYGFIPIPIIKEENNSLNVDSQTGKGFRHYTYKGVKGKWKLIKTRKHRLKGE